MGKEIMRDGDIAALRNRLKNEGRPMKSNSIRQGSTVQNFEVREGRVVTTEVMSGSTTK